MSFGAVEKGPTIAASSSFGSHVFSVQRGRVHFYFYKIGKNYVFMISDDANDSPTAERVIDTQPRSARLNVHYHEPPADITPRPVSDFLLTPESLEVPQPINRQSYQSL